MIQSTSKILTIQRSTSPPSPFMEWKGCQTWICQSSSFSICLLKPFADLLSCQTLYPLLTESYRVVDGAYRVGAIFLSTSKWDTNLEDYIRAYEFVDIRLEVTNGKRELWLNSNPNTQLFYSINELLPNHQSGIFTFKALVERVEELIYNECYSTYSVFFNS